MGKIIAITSPKGGVGKTTTAVNLSVAIAEQHKRVLLLDLDPAGQCAPTLGFKPQLLEGDILYIFSDGYADQFGGPRGKKMMYKKFRDTLIANSQKDLSVQKDLLRDHLYDWMGEEEQVDDILVIGVKV